MRSPLPEVRIPDPSGTIAAELSAATQTLQQAGRTPSQELALDAWSAIAGQRPGTVWLKRLFPPDPEFVPRYRMAITLLAKGAPLQYAVRKAAFRYLELEIDGSVLIPRVETERLVDLVLEFCESRAAGGSWGVVADIGTGSGAIALSLASEGALEWVVATDISEDALILARRNLGRIRPRVPVEIRKGSMLEPIRPGECDVLVSNPPYLSSAEYQRLDPMVRDYEPLVAFDGGPDGLDPYRTLLSEAAKYLRAGGLLALEIDSRRSDETLALALATRWSDARIVNDVFDRPRYLLATNLEGTT